MEYNGRYKIFDTGKIITYPVSERKNRVKLTDLITPEAATAIQVTATEVAQEKIGLLAREIVSARKKDLPVVFFTGAHLIKNGFGPLVADLVKRNIFTLVAGNAATSIHDFELALTGETSEDVPRALEEGRFGMAFEFNYINAALILGNHKKLGYGEAIGKMLCEESFRAEIGKLLEPDNGTPQFRHPEVSIQAVCYENNTPLTIHAGIGTDVIDQHVYFDGEAKGGCSGRDFLIYTYEISKFTKGGVLINIGSAVTGPEVFLKAASMAGNSGFVPKNIITADFDIRPYQPESLTNEESVGYYYRDQKSIVARVPQAYGGTGMYIGGNQKQTFPLFYKKLTELL
ncbi:MAG: hypothetical protein GXO83_07205 [Chlorobi bacterium]|nr:hypothetical protein [Chlorobiota bacterium]